MKNLLYPQKINKRETFKNRKELCSRLGVNVPDGQSNVKRFEYFLHRHYIVKKHQNSHSITLTPRKNALPKALRTSTINNDKYCSNGVALLGSYLPMIIANAIVEGDNYLIHITKTQIMKEIGLCNQSYLNYSDKRSSRLRTVATRLDEIHFYEVMDNKSKEVITTILSRMKIDKKILSFRTTYLVKDTKDGNPRSPTIDEIDLMDNLKVVF